MDRRRPAFSEATPQPRCGSTAPPRGRQTRFWSRLLKTERLHLFVVVFSDSATSWTVAHQAPLSTGFPRREYWSGLPVPSPGDFHLVPKYVLIERLLSAGLVPATGNRSPVQPWGPGSCH